MFQYLSISVILFPCFNFCKKFYLLFKDKYTKLNSCYTLCLMFMWKCSTESNKFTVIHIFDYSGIFYSAVPHVNLMRNLILLVNHSDALKSQFYEHSFRKFVFGRHFFVLVTVAILLPLFPSVTTFFSSI